MTHEPTIGIIGSGAMGSGIAQVAAQNGHKVLLYDSNQEALTRAKHNLEQTLNKLEEKGKIAAGEAEKIYKRLFFVEDLSAFDLVGLVIEAIVEDLSVKQAVFTELEKHVHRNAVLATNTSSLPVTAIAAACQYPDRVAGIHFFNPAPLMPLVEVIPGIVTDPKVITACVELISKWNKTVVQAKDTPGFIVNRVARPYYGESIRIYEEGIADFATIDWALKEFGGFKMGPFELMDMIGNDINYKVTETVWTQLFFDPKYKPSLTQKRLYEGKFFGRKSGKGYYSYQEGAVMPEPKKDPVLGKEIFERVIAMLINEAVEALYLQIANRDDIDTAMTKGVNYPKGLLKWCDELGAQHVLNILNNLHKQYEEERYRSSVLLKRVALSGTKFY